MYIATEQSQRTATVGLAGRLSAAALFFVNLVAAISYPRWKRPD